MWSLDDLIAHLTKYKDVYTSISIILALATTYVLKPAKYTLSSLFRLHTAPSLKSTVRIFVAAPLSSIDRHDGYVRVIDTIKHYVNDRSLGTVYCPYDTYFDPESNAYNNQSNSHAAAEVVREVKKADVYVLLIDELAPTSCYVEIGMALAQNKSVTIIYREGSLPWLLRPEAALSELGMRIRYYPVSSLVEISDIIRRSGSKMFAK